MNKERLVLGIDYGTDSVRTLLVDSRSGVTVASAIHPFSRWSSNKYCDPAKHQFRQHPLDYIEGLEISVRECLRQAGPEAASQVLAISIDTTGSTPVAVNEQGIPLALLPAYEEEPDAMFFLWKDHSSAAAATEINAYASGFEVDFLKYVGGIYSSEWFWSKLLYVLRSNSSIRKDLYSWVEHCDWMPFLLTGGTHVSQIKRSVCTAGHKALWSAEWNGLPPETFWSGLDPLLTGYRSRLYDKVFHAGNTAGTISGEWAKRLGLPATIQIGVGAMDAHMGAVGGQISPGQLCKVMGTSTCDMLVTAGDQLPENVVKGICGVVPGSIIPGMIGMEAGQSAFGDVYAWFKQLLSWPVRHLPAFNANTAFPDAEALMEQLIPSLSTEAASLPMDEAAPVSTDWFNGRRTPDANPFVKASIIGLELGTTAPHIFRSLVEATCFGSKSIIERFREEGVAINGLTGVGGIAKKSPFIMQMMADVTGLSLKVNRAEQTGALGAAMFAATVAGIYPSVEIAMEKMGQGFEKEYHPDKSKSRLYENRYRKYQAIGNFSSV